MHHIRNRLLVIAALVLASVWALFPRTVTLRQRGADGAFVERTVSRVPLKKGLDLQGGMYLALEVDESRGAIANKSEAIDRALKVVRTRIDEFGVSEPVVQKVGTQRIIVELPGVSDQQRATALVKNSAFLQFQITDKSGAFDRVLPRLDAVVREAGVAPTAGAPAPARANPLGGLFAPGGDSAARAAAVAESAAGDSALPDSAAPLPVGTAGPLSSLISPGGMPGEYIVAVRNQPTVERYLSLPAVQAALPPGKVIRWGTETEDTGGGAQRAFYVLQSRPILTGEYLTDARPATDPTQGTVVEFTLNNEGGRRFRTETGRNVGNYMAIVLDDRVMGRPPVIQSAIGTRGQITMQGQPLQAAQDLALVLRAGALPVPLKVVEVRQIGPSLGQDSIREGIRAGALGVALVVLIMVGYYRFSGVLAVTALLLYVLFTLAALAGLDATLTLPGLAGLVLSVGIAVDANVLIFERIREELAHGKTVRASVDEGFRHAMTAIVDSNVSTALTALVLYQFGTGPVRGFAITLLAGIAASMVSAIFVVRTFFLLWLARTRGAQPLSI